jgi:hypothetical protein
MKNSNCKNLGKLFGEYSIWGDEYLPCLNRNKKQEGVLYELLKDPKDIGYERLIDSLSNYRQDYSEFCEAYYDNLSTSSEAKKSEYTCVPYWGNEFWKTDPEKRIAIFAQKSLNRDGASMPLYFPLCEIESWEKAFEIGLRLSEKQSTKPFGWQSFMMVWIAMRFIFSPKILSLQQIYYSDIKKLDDEKNNMEFLKEEIKIIKPKLTILFGKTSYNKFKRLFDEEEIKVLFIYFPSGQGAIHDLQANKLKECQKELSNWLNVV